jgi:hypothetical protein
MEVIAVDVNLVEIVLKHQADLLAHHQRVPTHSQRSAGLEIGSSGRGNAEDRHR